MIKSETEWKHVAHDPTKPRRKEENFQRIAALVIFIGRTAPRSIKWQILECQNDFERCWSKYKRKRGGGEIKVGSSMEDHSFFSEYDLIQQLEQFMADFRLMDLDLQLLTLCVEY
jgi:hypothetical protein